MDGNVVEGGMDHESEALGLEVLEANDLTGWDVHEADSGVHDWLGVGGGCLLNLFIAVVILVLFILVEEARVDECVATRGPLPVLDASNCD